ncbi:MAG: hypothetical protein S4CHLAM37_14460 [Chlamydiia bacterium]|nr:hypothetical protein [Chlamydiia bacterium]
MKISRFLRNKSNLLIVSVAFLVANQAFAKEYSADQTPSKMIGVYFGGFGGWGFFKPRVSQKGTAFFAESAGGALAVNAEGKASTSHFGFGGLHLGYEWLDRSDKSWSIVPGVEFEGFYFTNKMKAEVINPTTRLPEHDFKNTFPTRTGVFIADGTVALENKYIVPYIGVGVGAGIISIHDADSKQVDPIEVGINHFNADKRAFDTSFAAQVKAGLRYKIFKHMRIFGEYRYLYLSPINLVFGSTDYPTHAVTAPWNVRISNMNYSLFSLGMDFTF